MSWPTDGLPRFKVSCVSGYTASVSGNNVFKTIYGVLDRADCHRQIAVMEWRRDRMEWRRDRAVVFPTKTKAEAFAAHLNAQ